MKEMMTLLLALLLSTFGMSQSARVSTLTRTVQMFGDLERKLATADATSKAQLLTDDFEERRCAAPGTPVPRNEWLSSREPSDTTFSQEAVHTFGDLSLYSALASEGNRAHMIVDTWKQANGSWKLAIRYRCPATGSKPAESAVPKRY